MARATGLFNIEWLDMNGQRSYPLAEHATKTDQSSDFVIPDSFILALYVPVHSGLSVDAEKFFIYSIAIFGTGFTVVVGYANDLGDPTPAASATIAASEHQPYDEYDLSGIGDFDDILGKIVIGDVSDLASLPVGQYIFDYEGGVLDTDCVGPVIRGLSSITLVNGINQSEPIYGPVRFVAGSNIRLTPTVLSEYSEIRIDAIDGEGLTDQCVCEGDATIGDPIRTINGLPPDESGNFTLVGNDCITLSALSSGVGIAISDSCATPCCGCEELAAVTSQMQLLSDAANNVTNFANRLESSVTTTSLVMLGSKLGDQGCSGCG